MYYNVKNFGKDPMIFKFMRKYVKILLWVIAVGIIPSFILWGIGSSVRNRQKTGEAGRVFDHRVSWNDFDQSLRSVKMFLVLSNLQGYLQYLDPNQLAWDRLMLLEEADHQKINVSDGEVASYIGKIPAFKTGDGFDLPRYKGILERSFGVTPNTFEEEVRKTLRIIKLRDKVLAEVVLDEETVKKEYHATHDKRKASYLEFLTQDFEKGLAASEEEITSFYNAHRDEFKRPEQIRVAFVTRPLEKDAKEEAKKSAKAVMDKLSDELYARRKLKTTRPEDLEELAKVDGLSMQQTDFFSMEDPPLSGFSYELYQESFRLAGGEVSDPIETATGVTIVMSLEKRPPHPLALEDAKSEVEKKLLKEKAEAACRKKAEETLQTLQRKMGAEKVLWEDAVKGAGLTLKETDLFTREGYLEKIGMAAEFSRAAFSLGLKEGTAVARIPNGFTILRPESEEPATEEAFTKDKDSFREKLIGQKQAKFYQEWFNALKGRAGLISHVGES